MKKVFFSFALMLGMSLCFFAHPNANYLCCFELPKKTKVHYQKEPKLAKEPKEKSYVCDCCNGEGYMRAGKCSICNDTGRIYCCEVEDKSPCAYDCEEPCGKCRGTGRIRDYDYDYCRSRHSRICPTCEGTGCFDGERVPRRGKEPKELIWKEPKEPKEPRWKDPKEPKEPRWKDPKEPKEPRWKDPATCEPREPREPRESGRP